MFLYKPSFSFKPVSTEPHFYLGYLGNVSQDFDVGFRKGGKSFNNNKIDAWKSPDHKRTKVVSVSKVQTLALFIYPTVSEFGFIIVIDAKEVIFGWILRFTISNI